MENLIKILLKTRLKPRLSYRGNQPGVINVLGTGPSLSQSIEKLLKEDDSKAIAVNDFASSDLFFSIKPSYYILVDNAYWQPEEMCTPKDVELRNKTFNSFKLVNWQMTLIIPSEVFSRGSVQLSLSNNNISYLPIVRTNIQYTGSNRFYEYLKKNYGGYFNNILACAIYSAINIGYKKIHIYGAEHSWTKDIRVDSNNRVCTIKRHFFEDDSELIPWLNSDGTPFTMDVILYSLASTFKAYGLLRKYADWMGVEVINYTPDSFIDAFKRSY